MADKKSSTLRQKYVFFCSLLGVLNNYNGGIRRICRWYNYRVPRLLTDRINGVYRVFNPQHADGIACCELVQL